VLFADGNQGGQKVLEKGPATPTIDDHHVDAERPVAIGLGRPWPQDKDMVRAAMGRLKAAKAMQVTSPAGTDLHVDLTGTTAPGTMAHWPGDMNLTFKRYVEAPVRLDVTVDYATHVGGTGTDAELFRSCLAACGDRDAYAVSHVGWGLNARARRDSLTMCDRGHTLGKATFAALPAARHLMNLGAPVAFRAALTSSLSSLE
jgi:2,5-dihydroxypyridine 5,6-dioxygenase